MDRFTLDNLDYFVDEDMVVSDGYLFITDENGVEQQLHLNLCRRWTREGRMLFNDRRISQRVFERIIFS